MFWACVQEHKRRYQVQVTADLKLCERKLKDSDKRRDHYNSSPRNNKDDSTYHGRKNNLKRKSDFNSFNDNNKIFRPKRITYVESDNVTAKHYRIEKDGFNKHYKTTKHKTSEYFRENGHHSKHTSKSSSIKDDS